jgi:probable O-glycosylation ligase (exosortase A-associated)
MRDIVTALIVFGSLPYTIKNTYVGVLTWSWIAYMNPHRLGWGFARDYPFAYLVAIVTLFSFLFNREPKTFPKNSLVFVWFSFLCWMGITTLFAIFPEISLEQLIKVGKIQLFAILSLLLFGSIDRINKLIWVIVISLSYFGVKGGIFTIMHGGSFTVWGPPGTFIEGNNELALAILMVMPLMYYLRAISDNNWIKFGLLVGMVLMGASALGSQSRGALLAALVMLLLFWSKSKNKIITAVIGGGVAIGLISFMPDTWHKRMDTIETYEQDGSAMGRINAWETAFNLAKDRFFGGGFDGINVREIFQLYAPNPLDYHDAHSIYFEVLGDHGFIGLMLFLVLGFITWQTAKRVINLSNDVEELSNLNLLARMLQVSLLAYATGGAFLGLAYFDLYYHIIVLVLLVNYLVGQNTKIQK